MIARPIVHAGSQPAKRILAYVLWTFRTARVPPATVCDIEQGCVPEPDPGACQTEADCTMADGCTENVVCDQRCVYYAKSDGAVCDTDKQCMAGRCIDLCSDGVLSGDETAIDCGGSCTPCVDGLPCTVNDDCQSGICDLPGSMTCEPANTCGNGTSEAGEGCDDGGAIAGDGCDASCLVELGGACSMGTDCASGFCASDNICRVVGCNNTVQDGTETDVDCGGMDCAPCGAGQMCTLASDCASNNCPAGTCHVDPPHCLDGVISGDETGFDCGGGCSRTCIDYDCAAQTQIPETECQQLENFFDATGGQNWTTTTGWFTDNAPCTWMGLTCTAIPGNVDVVNIDEDNLDGVLIDGFDALTEASDIAISAATCCTGLGPASNLRGTLPLDFANLTKLRRLALFHHQLTGPLPPEYDQAPALEELWLFENQLSGQLPAELWQMTDLRIIDFGVNNFDGTFPTSVGNLVNLTLLSLGSNNFTGSIPPEFGQLVGLAQFSLDRNQLVGTIPIEIGQLVLVQTLHLSWNQLAGAIPSQLMNLTNLTILDICDQAGGLTSSVPVGNWLRGISTSDWSATDVC